MSKNSFLFSNEAQEYIYICMYTYQPTNQPHSGRYVVLLLVFSGSMSGGIVCWVVSLLVVGLLVPVGVWDCLFIG